MRRIYGLAAILAGLLFLLPLPARAQGSTTYDWADVDLRISIPNTYYVFTQDTPADDPAYINSGISKETEDKLLKDGDIYLDAVSEDLSHDIFLATEDDNVLGDFSTASDGILTAIGADWRKMYEEMGRYDVRSELYQHRQTKFIKIYSSTQTDTGTLHMVEYFTVNAGKEISVTLYTRDGIVGRSRENALQGIVDSIYFQKIAAPTAKTDPFVYTDPSCGLRFTVPAGWKGESFTADGGIAWEEFSSVSVKGLSIRYWCIDYFSMSETENREEIDTVLSPEKAIQAYANGTGEDKVSLSKVTYGGKEYSKGEEVMSASFEGLKFDVTGTYLLHAENGYLFCFQFEGTEKDPHYKDMEALLNSAVYPTSSAPVGVTETPIPETAATSAPPSHVTAAPSPEAAAASVSPSDVTAALSPETVQPASPISPDAEGDPDRATDKTETPPSDPPAPTPSSTAAGLSVGSGMVIVAVSVLAGVILALAVWTLCLRRSLRKESLSSGEREASGSPAPPSPAAPEEPGTWTEEENLPEGEAQPPQEEAQPSSEEVQPSPEEVQQPPEEAFLPCEEAPPPPEVEEQTPEDASERIPSRQALFCYNCGAKLPPDSVYCQACGTKIELEDEEE